MVIRPRSSLNRFGEASWGSPTTFQCRLTDLSEETRSPDGTIERVSSVMWLNTTRGGFSVDDQVTLPDGTSPTILSIQTFRDEKGIAFTKIKMGDRLGAQETNIRRGF